jgi:hypothetical protein
MRRARGNQEESKRRARGEQAEESKGRARGVLDCLTEWSLTE